MKKSVFKIKVVNEAFGELLDETFVDETQFKIFLKMVHGCIVLENDLTFYNGDTFLINIPYKFLKNSIIVTSNQEVDIMEQVKSKIEALVTK